MDRLGTGVRVLSVHVVDIHPPQEAVSAFRDVSSAREERETRIHGARERLAREVPLARGQAAKDLAKARSAAEARRVLAGGRSRGFSARAASFAGHPALLRHLLWLESAERVLAGRRKFIVPPRTAGRGVTLWEDRPRVLPPGTTGTGTGVEEDFE